jgi:hypothetical protein
MTKKLLLFAFIALFTGSVFYSCNKNDDKPKDDGKIDPCTIATENLIAYWDFEDSPKDAISGRGEATSAVTYPIGRRGKGFQGGENSYISFDLSSTDKLATLNAFTIAMWVKTPAIPAGNGLPCFFQLSGNGWEGALTVFQENLGDNTADSLNIRGYFGKKGVPWAGQWWGKSHPSMAADRWFHFVVKYDNETSIATIHVNGDTFVYQTLSAYETPVRYQDDPGSADNENGAPKLGDLDLQLRESNNKGIIGYWAIKAFYGGDDEWQGFFPGMIDELRIYDKALSDAEVKDLFDAEVTQINE